MERTLIINEVLNHNITKFTNTLIPPDFNGDVHKLRILQEFLKQIISNLGTQSAAAQGLSKVITTGEKLQQSMNHYLYLLKDPRAKDNHGDVVGFLKVGYKRLYLFDSKNMVCEVEPLCVLDFYVEEKYRRQGHGRRLFDHMIEDMNVNPHELAIDGPSQNMINFLAKNYNMDQLVRHNNNFAVSPLFFETLPQNASSSRDATESRSPRVGRFTAIRPPSSIASIIHGGDQPSDVHNNRNGHSPGDRRHYDCASTIFLKHQA